jgi:hypothetical protein
MIDHAVWGWTAGCEVGRPSGRKGAGRRPCHGFRHAQAYQQDQSEDLLEDQVEQSQQHGGDHAEPMAAINHRWSAARAVFWNPAWPGVPIVRGGARGVSFVIS